MKNIKKHILLIVISFWVMNLCAQNEFKIIKINNNLLKFKNNFTLIFDKNGNITYGTLVEETVFKNGNNIIPLGINQMLTFYENGYLNHCALAKNTYIKVGNNLIPFRGGAVCEFYKNGNVSYGTLAFDTILNVGIYLVPLLSPKEIKTNYIQMHFIRFFENGVIESGELSNDFKAIINKKKFVFKNGTDIYFYDNSSILSGTLAENVVLKIQKKKFLIDDYVSFYENGIVEESHLSEDIKIKINNNNSLLITGSNISNSIGFHPNGCIATCIAGEDKTLSVNDTILNIKKGDFLEFDKQGQISVSENIYYFIK